MDYNNLFKCPKCGASGCISLVKVVNTLVIIKQRCLKHGERVIKVPLIQKDLFLNLIRDNLFLCYKCGQPASVESTKLTGPWTILKLNCPTHGTKLPDQKIWNSIYGEISSGAGQPSIKIPQQTIEEKFPEAPPESMLDETPQVEPIITSRGKALFCPNCGTQIKGNEKFCGTCGTEL